MRVSSQPAIRTEEERAYVTWSFHSFPTIIVEFSRLYDGGSTQIIFENTRPPPGYVSVPAGNAYITRNCRRLTEKSNRDVYATYVRTFALISLLLFCKLNFRQRSQWPKKRAKQVGLHVPIDVLEQVKSDYEKSKTKVSDSIWRMLHNSYPNMPPADKTKVHRLVWSHSLSSQSKSVLSRLYYIIYGYYRDSYTPFRSLNTFDSPDKEAISEVHVTVRKAMDFWGGKTQCMESHQHEDGAGLPSAQPPKGRTPHNQERVCTQQPNNQGTEGKHSTPSARK